LTRRSDLSTSQRSDSVRHYVTRSGRSRSTVLSAPWCRQNQSLTLTDYDPQIGSANGSQIRHCPTLCHKVGHGFVGTMVPTKSKSDTYEDRIYETMVGQCQTLCHKVGHQFCRHHGADKIEGRSPVPRSDLPTDQSSDTVRLYVTRSVMVLSAPWCRQNRSLSASHTDRPWFLESDLPTAHIYMHCLPRLQIGSSEH
jgi:hypothetical protein